MIPRIVYDCNIFAQAILNPKGPAGRCFELAQSGQVELFVSEFVLEEIGELHTKLPLRMCVTDEDTDDLVQIVRSFAVLIDPVPVAYIHPIDIDDSGYVNLAIAADAKIIVSRDKHLLGLNDSWKPWSSDFRTRFPELRLIAPEQYLDERKKS